MGRVVRYSEAFKLKVVEQIERGEFTVAEARQVYDIGCRHTIDNWLRRRGKQYLIPNVIRVTMKSERDRIKELERRNRRLERALADERLRTLSLEAALEVYEEEYGSKKNFAADLSKKPSRKPKQKGSK